MTDPKLLATTGGIFLALLIFVLTLLSHIAGISILSLKVLTDLAPFYSVGLLGSIIGALWGFMVGYVLLYAFSTIREMLK